MPNKFFLLNPSFTQWKWFLIELALFVHWKWLVQWLVFLLMIICMCISDVFSNLYNWIRIWSQKMYDFFYFAHVSFIYIYFLKLQRVELAQLHTPREENRASMTETEMTPIKREKKYKKRMEVGCITACRGRRKSRPEHSVLNSAHCTKITNWAPTRVSAEPSADVDWLEVSWFRWGSELSLTPCLNLCQSAQFRVWLTMNMSFTQKSQYPFWVSLQLIYFWKCEAFFFPNFSMWLKHAGIWTGCVTTGKTTNKSALIVFFQKNKNKG